MCAQNVWVIKSAHQALFHGNGENACSGASPSVSHQWMSQSATQVLCAGFRFIAHAMAHINADLAIPVLQWRYCNSVSGNSKKQTRVMSTQGKQDDVYKQDMPNEMLQACQRAARAAINDQSGYGTLTNKEQSIASSVRKAIEKQYPGTWSCVCGQRFGRSVHLNSIILYNLAVEAYQRT